MDSLTLQDERAAAVAVAPRVTKLDIEGKIVAVNYNTAEHAFYDQPTLPAHQLLTICVITMRNGFTVLGKAACASPENFNQETGRQIAYEDAFNQIWALEGYLLKDQLSNNMVDRLARTTHEANRAWCALNGDDSQAPWDEAPDWQKTSFRNGVVFHLANPNATDSASHENWMIEKLEGGWTYGDVKDPEAKTHPCLVPFDQLPPAQQFKDRLFRTIVRSYVR